MLKNYANKMLEYDKIESNVNLQVLHDFAKFCVKTCAHEEYMCVCAFSHTRFCFMHAYICTDLYQKNFGGPLLCHEIRFQIS